LATAYPTQQYSQGIRWVLYLVSIFISAPISGIIIWVVLNGRGDPESKELGRRCGIISIIAFVVICLCVVIFNVFFIGLVGLSGTSTS
jgi:hypothetical protein